MSIISGESLLGALRRLLRSRARGLAAIIGLSSVAWTGTVAASPAPGDHVHASGITVLASLPTPPDPLALAFSVAVGEADQASLAWPSDLGFPWVDRQQSQLVIPSVSAAGRAAASSILARPSLAQVSRRVDVVRHSRAKLQRIIDGAIGPQPGGAVVYASYPDPAHDRVILEASQAPDAFLYALAGRFDATAIAVYVQPSHRGSGLSNRNNDISPFWGGAQINAPAGGCTDAFSWHAGSTQMMLTAGHCAPNGGGVSTPASSMGSVNSNTEESWNGGVGTVYLSGQSTYRGDIALIRLYSGLLSTGIMYRGGPGSGQTATVMEQWSRSPQNGDQYCTGGAYSGEICGWVVDWVGGNYYYSDSNETARHVTHGTKKAWCVIPGDSGGPTYTVRSDGGIAAKGIISGVNIHDNYADWYEPWSCENVFTDIWDAWYAFPGILTLG